MKLRHVIAIAVFTYAYVALAGAAGIGAASSVVLLLWANNLAGRPS